MYTLESVDLAKISPEKLGELLINAKKAYYTTGKPIMDDHTYDTLEEILKKKLPYHRLFTKIGTPNFDTGWTKKKHSIPMGSQNKVNSYSDLIHYFELKVKHLSSSLLKGGEGVGFVVQPKCDGISLEIEYQNGQLVNAITRGDGIIGDIITQNVVKMQNLVVSLPKNLSGSVRCEIVVTKKDFDKLSQIVKIDSPATAGPEGFYSNPRNAASGISQRLDSKYAHYCSLFAVDIIADVKTENDKIILLNSLGFTTVESHLCHNFTEIEKIYQQFLLETRLNYPFDIDGLVIKINDLKLAETLGSQNNRPKHQVAYKFPSRSNQTVIKSVTWQVGPMGTITPVAKVEPVEISGATISFASLANYKLVTDMNLGLGDVVHLSRRGDVIPHIEYIISKVNTGHIDIPQYCPTCHTKLLIEPKFLRCPNPDCPGRTLGSLRLFCSILDIKGISDKTITKLYHSGRLRLPGDFYKLKPEDIASLDNLGDKSAKNIIFQIQSKRNLSLRQAIFAAAVPNFSVRRINQLITAGFDSPEKILGLTLDNLTSLPGFKHTLAQKILNGLTFRRHWLKSILDNINIVTPKNVSANRSLEGKNICITGQLSHPREYYSHLIETHGGRLMTAVTSTTSFLLTNETDSNSSKFVAAKKYKIPIITENEFNRLINISSHKM